MTNRHIFVPLLVKGVILTTLREKTRRRVWVSLTN